MERRKVWNYWWTASPADIIAALSPHHQRNLVLPASSAWKLQPLIRPHEFVFVLEMKLRRR